MSASADAVAPPKLRYAWVWWTIGWLLVAATVNESLRKDVWNVVPMPSDKALHFIGYFGLAMWFAGLARRSRYFAVAAFLIALGGALEIAQGVMSQGRQPEWMDFFANSAGVASALAVAALGLGDWMVWIERLLRLQK